MHADGGSRTPTGRFLKPVPLTGWATSATCVMQPDALAAAADHMRRRAAPGGAPRAARPSPGALGPVSGHAERRRDDYASRLLSCVEGRRAAPFTQRAPRALELTGTRSPHPPSPLKEDSAPGSDGAPCSMTC